MNLILETTKVIQTCGWGNQNPPNPLFNGLEQKKFELIVLLCMVLQFDTFIFQIMLMLKNNWLRQIKKSNSPNSCTIEVCAKTKRRYKESPCTSTKVQGSIMYIHIHVLHVIKLSSFIRYICTTVLRTTCTTGMCNVMYLM